MFYIDYLDYMTSGNQYSLSQITWLRFDLLLFCDDILCLSVPACVKLRQTTKTLMELDDFWKHGTFRLQLDDKHKKDPMKYFYNRTKKLESSMSEEKLKSHFEFQAYNDDRTRLFYKEYLPQVVSADPQKIFISKVKDTDELFRVNSVSEINTHYTDFLRILPINRGIVLNGIFNDICQAANANELFQRSLIEDEIINKYHPSIEERKVVSSILDRAFARANSETSSAIPLSLVTNQLTGKWLVRLLKSTFPDLLSEINNLKWYQVYQLSQCSDWHDFITALNALIYFMDKSAECGNMEKHITKLNLSYVAYTLLKFIENFISSSIKSSLKSSGFYYESHDFESRINLAKAAYTGNLRPIFDALSLIEISVKRLFQFMARTKYEYLRMLETKQKEKSYISY